MVSVYCVQC